MTSTGIRSRLLGLSSVSEYPGLAYSDSHCYNIRPFGVWCSPTMASADSRSLAFFSHSAFFFASLTGPPGVRHNSFVAQPPDLLLRFYVYPSGFGFLCSRIHRLASYPVSVRRLLGFATPLPPLLPLPVAACGSLHLAVTTRGGTFTRKNRAMPGTQTGARAPRMASLRKASFISHAGLNRYLFSL